MFFMYCMPIGGVVIDSIVSLPCRRVKVMYRIRIVHVTNTNIRLRSRRESKVGSQQLVLVGVMPHGR
jgi:hypothetical protein